MHQINVLTFSELGTNDQKKQREHIRSMLMDSVDLSCEVDYLKDGLQGIGFYNVEIRYSLGCGQGDGASFIGKIKEADAAKAINAPISKYAYENVITIKSIDSRYSHSRTVVCESDDVTEEFLEKFNQWRIEKCNDIYQSLIDYWEGAYNDEAIDCWIADCEPTYVINNRGNAIQL